MSGKPTNMTHPEIKVSWVSSFLRTNGKLIASRAENADFSPLSASISVHLRPELNSGCVMFVMKFTVVPATEFLRDPQSRVSLENKLFHVMGCHNRVRL